MIGSSMQIPAGTASPGTKPPTAVWTGLHVFCHASSALPLSALKIGARVDGTFTKIASSSMFHDPSLHIFSGHEIAQLDSPRRLGVDFVHIGMHYCTKGTQFAFWKLLQ
jgi:hypothetical protein